MSEKAQKTSACQQDGNTEISLEKENLELKKALLQERMLRVQVQMELLARINQDLQAELKQLEKC